MWTPQNRKRYDRSRLRYPSDLTDEEWAHIAPVISPAKPGGNKRTVDVAAARSSTRKSFFYGREIHRVAALLAAERGFKRNKSGDVRFRTGQARD
jgi:hypothetical protein